MSAGAIPSAPRELIRESLRIAGEKVLRDRVIEIRHPYSGALVGTVPKASLDDVKRALRMRGTSGLRSPPRPLPDPDESGCHHCIEARGLARLITLESGLCLKDSGVRGRTRLGCSAVRSQPVVGRRRRKCSR